MNPDHGEKDAKGEREQERADRFYMDHGPCCAGCDWWHRFGSMAGECRRAAPVAGAGRIAMLGISYSSPPLEAGHVMTTREHHCGEFKDEFEWTSLPPHYLRRIGWAAPAATDVSQFPKPDRALHKDGPRG